MRIDYWLKFDDGAECHLVWNFDPSMRQKQPSDLVAPRWTKLSIAQCAHCPLKCDVEEYCPAAISVYDILQPLSGRSGEEDVLCEVRTPQRTIKERVALKVAVGSCLGLALATCGCPVLDLLRPMAFLHIPFASASETYVRNFGMALLGFWLRAQKNMDDGLGLEHFHQYQERLSQINQAMCQRLGGAAQPELGKDAVLVLDVFAQFFRAGEVQMTANLEGLFSAWLQAGGPLEAIASDELEVVK